MSKEKQPSELDRRMSEMVINDKGNQNVQKKPDNEDKDKDKDKKERKDVKCIDKVLTEICENFIRDINNFGISVLDGFLGQERGDLVLEEVLQLHESGRFQEGQLVRNNTTNNSIRGDEILWLRGNEDEYPNIRRLINDIDRVVIAASKFPNNGKLGNYRIGSRTKVSVGYIFQLKYLIIVFHIIICLQVMVACYPGNGAQYVKHVDNPNVDARIITAIYYLNKNWDRKVVIS